MEIAKAIAKQTLSNLGFHVDVVAETTGRRADLLVRDESSSYLIEVKEKRDSPADVLNRKECFESDEVYEQVDPLSRDNRISGILRDARKQLTETPKENEAFQLIWFHASGVDSDLKFRQAFATFYGHVDLRAVQPPSAESVPCLYFDYSLAVDMPEIDALILLDKKHIQVCVNEFSHRIEDFRRTQLFRTFDELRGVFDPAQMINEKKCIACRFELPRRDDRKICQALREQTGVLYDSIRLNRYSFSALAKPAKD
ncbi:MAG: hypothetical protein WDZ59_08555 [Pirellulales bacterium]